MSDTLLNPGEGTIQDSTPEWLSSIDEGLRENPSLQNIKDINNLAKVYVDTKSKVGSMISIPGEEATQEDWGKIFDKLGRPETADGYEVSLGEDAPDEVQETISQFKAKAHEFGLSKAQAENMFKWYNETEQALSGKTQEAYNAKLAEAKESLQKEWGDKFEEKMNQANAAATHYGLLQELGETGLINSPKIAKILADIGANLSEDQIKGNGSVNNDLKTEYEKFMAENGEALTSRKHTKHDWAVKQKLDYETRLWG